MVNKITSSIIIPTLNADKYISTCLESLKKQDYDKRKYEILIIDGGSKDKTLEIVKKYIEFLPIQIMHNKYIDAESGKLIGIKQSRGDLVVLLDSDNEALDESWLRIGIQTMNTNKKIWGLESPWILNESDPLINQYFTLLKIADPLARMLNPKRTPIEKNREYEIYKLEKNAVVVTGANGFFWRKSRIKPYLMNLKKFEEVNFVSLITENEVTYFGKLVSLGIYHYYCDSVFKYFGKRVKIARKFSKRRSQKQKTWVDYVSRVRLYLSIIYLGSAIGPFVESVINLIKTRKIAWLYHCIIAVITVIIYAYTYVKKII